MVPEFGLDHHDPPRFIHWIIHRRKADFEIDSVLFGEGFRPFEGAVIRKAGNLQGFEECADASGSQFGLSAVKEMTQTFRGLPLGQPDSPVGCEGVESMVWSEGAEHTFQNLLLQSHRARLDQGGIEIEAECPQDRRPLRRFVLDKVFRIEFGPDLRSQADQNMPVGQGQIAKNLLTTTSSVI